MIGSAQFTWTPENQQITNDGWVSGNPERVPGLWDDFLLKKSHCCCRKWRDAWQAIWNHSLPVAFGLEGSISMHNLSACLVSSPLKMPARVHSWMDFTLIWLEIYASACIRRIIFILLNNDIEIVHQASTFGQLFSTLSLNYLCSPLIIYNASSWMHF